MRQRYRVRSQGALVRASPPLLGLLAVLAVGVLTVAQVRTPAAAAEPAPATAPTPATPDSAPAGTPATPAAADGPPANGVLFLVDLFNKGGYVMWALAGCSVLALAIIFERLHALRRSQVLPPGFLDGLRLVWGPTPADREKALAYCRANDSPMGRMVAAFVKRLPRGSLAAEKAVEDAGSTEALRLRAHLRPFYAIGSVATLLGLIGTIAGMIRAFMATAKAGAADNRVELLSTGIYEAMVCTFGGLAVAILVTSFYYYFVGRVEKLIVTVNDELTRFSDEFVGDADGPK